MLPLLQWLDRHPAIYAVAFVLITFAAASALSFAGRNASTPTRFQRWGLPALFLAVLFAGRWPHLFVLGELNPDASQFLAGAITLQHDPVFWRSVDGMTAGPLIYYVLTLCGWLGLPLTYATSRLVALALLGLTFAFCHRLIAAHHGPRIAALAALPATLFFALTPDPDFNHYSSEMVPIALLSLAALLLLHPRGQSHLGWISAGAFVAGLMPWAKLQAAPLAAVLGIFALVRLARDDKRPLKARSLRIAVVIAVALLPTVLVLVMVLGWHSFDDFYRSYVVQNVLYTDPSKHRLLGRESRFFQGDFSTLGYLAIILLAFAWTVAALPRLHRQGSRPGSPLLPAGLVLIGLGAVCVITPGRDFLHYTLLLLPGTLLLSGAAAGECHRVGRHRTAVVLCIATGLGVLLLRVKEPLPATLGRLVQNHRAPDGKLGNIVRLLNAHDRQVGVWGWEMQVYVESGSRQATRSAYSYWQISPGPQRDYFRERYLGDLRRNRPPVFIDAVGEATKFFSGRSRLAHESFPALAEFIARDYCLVAELRFARVYARRDLLADGTPTQKEIWREFRLARGTDYLSNPEPVDLARFDLPREMVGRRFSLILRPPAQLEIPLGGTEREFRFGYGYLPEAEQQGTGNGTEVTLSLTSPSGEERVLRQFIHNPAHDDALRGHRTLRLLLPPDLPADSTLTVSTGPGPHGDDAWDWFYITQLGLVRTSSFNPRQFPAFNRPPDEISAPLASISGGYGNPELLLHAPARLRFLLAGHERTLQFTYGLKPGAFNGREQSNGAKFRVTATAPGLTPRVLFERTLRPATLRADRPEQTADLTLPAFSAGTWLEIEIDPNGSNAWDWTYLSSLRLG